MKNQVNELAKGLTMTDDIIQIYCECKKYRIKLTSPLLKTTMRTFKRKNTVLLLTECINKIEQHLDIDALKKDNTKNIPKELMYDIEEAYPLTKSVTLKELLNG